MCACICVCMSAMGVHVLSFLFSIFPPRQVPTTAPLSPCADLFLYKYIQKDIRPRARERVPLSARGSFDRRAQKDPARARLASVSACLPAFFSFHLFLSFRHSEYVVPILTGVPFSSVKMKNKMPSTKGLAHKLKAKVDVA